MQDFINKYGRYILMALLALGGIWLFNNVFGALLGAILLKGKTEDKVEKAKARADVADERQAVAENKVVEQQKVTDQALKEADHVIENIDQPDVSGEQLEDRFNNRSRLNR